MNEAFMEARRGEEQAHEHLEAIHSFMERSERYSNLSGWSCIIAGLLAVAGASVIAAFDLSYATPASRLPIALIWGAVIVLSLGQNIAFTVTAARRKGEPVWSRLTQTVTLAVVPGFAMAAILTVMCMREGLIYLLPGLWMLSYAMSLFGLSLFSGKHIRIVAAAFLVAGAASVSILQDHRHLMMAVSFGGLHILVGAWIVARYRE